MDHYERILTTTVLTADNVVVSSDSQEVFRYAPNGGEKNKLRTKLIACTTTLNKKQRHWRYRLHVH